VVAQLELPESYRQRIRATGRGEWVRWLADLPDVVDTLAERWGLSLGELYPLSWNYVVAAEREPGDLCVLKIGPPVEEAAEGTVREARALRLCVPAGVRLLKDDADAGALLLERAIPGTPVAEKCDDDDDQATEILASAMLEFWVPADATSGLPPVSSLEETFEGFDRGPHGASVRKDLVQTLAEIDSGLRDLRAGAVTARRVFEELVADRAPTVVLHGDLHHDNVLLSEERGWVVVDPKGFFGDAAYDTAAMLYNPLDYAEPVTDPEPMLRRRLAITSGVLGMDRDVLAAWGFVKVVLSLLWNLDDGGELRRDTGQMRTMATLRRMI
jgi:streptomycin 6-kinase